MAKQNGINAFIRERGFQLVMIVVSGVVAFAVLGNQVKTLAKDLVKLEEKLAEYPSKDWFELKFETLEEAIESK